MDTIELENNVKLDRLLMSNPYMEKKVQKIIRTLMAAVQSSVRKDAEPLSKKAAYLAVRKAVYKKILGGNVNILSPYRKAGKAAPLPPESPRKKSHAVGGNRIPRSRRTEDLLTYQGADRAFILRYINQGTKTRTSRFGNRGSIQGNNWFGQASRHALELSSQWIDFMLDGLIQSEFNKK